MIVKLLTKRLIQILSILPFVAEKPNTPIHHYFIALQQKKIPALCQDQSRLKHSLSSSHVLSRGYGYVEVRQCQMNMPITTCPLSR